MTSAPSNPPGPKRPAWLLLAILLVPALAAVVWLIATHPDWAWALRERAERGAKLRIIDYVKTGFWWATLANAILLAVLAATARWWFRPVALSAVPSGLTRPLWLLIVGITLCGGWFRAERLDLSLYGDEAYTLRSYVLGRWKADASGEPKFLPLPWIETAFQEREASNHVPFSLLSRLGTELWQATVGEEGRFDAAIFRLPSFLFGLATIPLLAWLGGLLGFPRAGLLAALLLALHPWHIRYSSEARGYAMMMAFAVLTTAFLVRGLRGGRWRDWIGFGLTQWLLLWSYPGALYFAVTLNLAAAGAIGTGPRHLFPRWLVGGTVGVMAIAITLGPDIPQIIEYLRLDRARGSMGFPWIRDFSSLLLAGAHWRSPDPSNPILIAARNAAVSWPLLGLWIAGLAPLLLAAGAVGLARAGRIQFWIALGLLACAPLGYLHASRAGNLLFLWYLIFALPGVVLLLAIGATGWWKSTRISAIAGTAAAVAFAAATHPAREAVRAHSKEPLLPVVRTAYAGTDPFELRGATGPIVACFWSNAPLYDPWMVYVWKPIDLVIAMERALAENRPLYITFGHRQRALSTVPHILRIAEDPALFEPAGTFHGLEEAQFTHFLLRLRADAATVQALREAHGAEQPSPNPGYSKRSN